MKQLLIAALVATVALAEHDYQGMFETFKASYTKTYADEAEETKRFSNFVENTKRIEALQAANPLAEFGMNEFADLSEADFKPRHNAEHHIKLAMAEPRNMEVFSEEQIAAARGAQIDWRKRGAVTGVKNQWMCGSCWAFAATGNIEGQWFLAGHKLTPLSEQELVSCDSYSSGCKGGSSAGAFQWLLSNTGGNIATEKSLSYSSRLGFPPRCPSNLNALTVGATIKNVVNIPSNEEALAAAVYENGPITVSVDGSSFQFYFRGIMTNCKSKSTDHAVLVVGYDDTHNPPYWIVKNSWGGLWGESGYIRIAKGSNQCLISEFPVSAKV